MYDYYRKGCRDFDEKSSHFLNQKVKVEFGDGRVEEYTIPDGDLPYDDLKDWIEQIFTDDLQYSAKITWYYESRTSAILYDGKLVEKWADNTEKSYRSDIFKLRRTQEKIDGWQPALDWARENGASIRKGKISKWLARVRIDEAGLREEWNQLYPDYAFSERDVEYAKEVLKDREEMYSKRKKKTKKR